MGMLEKLEPKEVFRYFEEICAIPHGSGNTKAISDYLVSFAKEHELEYRQDSYNNVVIFKDGTAGYENSQPIILQGHMDMVCEKDRDCDIDFEEDGLKISCDDEYVFAEGTTLGGDDGVAIAYALAILADNTGSIKHPPLEVIITVDEEIGMLGATHFHVDDIKGKVMINLDSENEGEFLVSCAGGATMTCSMNVRRKELEQAKTVYTLEVSGLSGGHSGMEINKQGANANKLLARILYGMFSYDDISLVAVVGGSKDNAIPKEATAYICLEDEQNFEALCEYIEYYGKIIMNEYKHTDPELEIIFSMEEDTAVTVVTSEDSKKAITMLYTLPNGVERMSQDIEGMVQTSLNMGILTTEEVDDDFANIHCSYSVRSSVESEKEELIARCACMVNIMGGNVTINGEYPAWEYTENSNLRACMAGIYRKMYGEKPKIEAVHAGVECGIFASKIEGLDCVSIGPNMKDIHTTDEKLDIQSVKRTYEFLLEVLAYLQ